MNVIETAFEWHGGKRSALYSFASTRQLWSEEHRQQVIEELDNCPVFPEQEPGDSRRLMELRDTVFVLPVGEALPDPYALEKPSCDIM